MKKAYFYSMMRTNDKTHAAPHFGYTDGFYYYYRSVYGSTWYAIHPENGLSITTGKTRKEAQRKATAPSMAERITEALKRNPQAADTFAKLKAEAETGAA